MAAPTPIRPDEEVAAGFISATLGGQARNLPVLSIERNREWKKVYNATVSELGGDAESDDFDAVVDLLSGAIDKMVDLLIAYDETGALGGREWIDKHATDREVYELLKGPVLQAAFPFGIDLMAQVLGAIRANMARLAVSSPSTSSSQRSTGGRRRRSNAA